MLKMFLIILTIILSAFSLWAKDISFNDLYSIPSCSDPQISPDGMLVAFGLHTSDPSTNIEQDHLWIMNSDGLNVRQLTYGSSSEWQARWLPDGKSILFLSDREGGAQVWMLPMNGGETHRVTAIPTLVSEFEMFPKNRTIIFESRVFPECQNDSCIKAAIESAEEDKNKLKLYDKLLYRHYNNWADDRVKRMYMANIDDSSTTAIYSSRFDTPTSLLGGFRDYAVSPDGKEICFAMTTDSMPAAWPNNNLYIITPPNKDANEFTDGPGLETTPRYSPDGKLLSYLGTARAGYESDQRDLMVYNRGSKKTVNLTDKFDRSINEYVWDPKSQYICFTAFERGFSKVWRVGINSGKIEKLLDDAVYGDLHFSPDGSYLIVNRSLSNQPAELYRYDIAKRKLSRLTHFADKAIADLKMSPTEEFWFIGVSGDSVHGFLTRPPDFDSNKKYPLALLIHGGPQFCWLRNFNYYGWNTQLMAAQGYIIA
jgi:dipeptidyl aminopeptidase/acylaminoacyl peptidase